MASLLPPPTPAQPEEIERAALARLALQVQAVLQPALAAHRKAALARAITVLDRGEPLTAEVAIGAVMELYAVERLERILTRQVRRGEQRGEASSALPTRMER